jgi:uncharacterized protein
MIYKDFQDIKLSNLGMGLMRLPVVDDGDSKIDELAAAEMVDYAYNHGINYFDTAWGYHAGQSELVAGRALSRYPRESFYLASKFPGYDTSNFGKHEEIFAKQLEKLQTDYLDFYLIHNVCELNIDPYADDAIGTVPYFVDQKKVGRIKHLGFSAHGNYETVKRFLEKFGSDMEFCQLQVNYMDYGFQEAERKMQLLAEYGIPVWVMEPLRGGQLAEFEEQDAASLETLRPGVGAVEWAFRFLQSLPTVDVILTGASSLDQLKQNIQLFEEPAPLTDEEMQAILAVGNRLATDGKVPCTKCHYCTSHCPQGLDIPYLISLYNEHISREGMRFMAPFAISALPEDKRPAACIGCRSCEAVCPQQIAIADVFTDFNSQL